MAPTTRSSRASSGVAAATKGSAVEDSSSGTTRDAKKTATKFNKDKVYSKKAPEPKFEQLRFPSTRKIVREKKTTAANKKQERHSLPAPATSSNSGVMKTYSKKKRNKREAADKKKQSTLTQMRWVPSTFDEEIEGDERLPFLDLSGERSDEDDFTTKKPAATRRSKRRKTTGDLELVDEDGEPVPSSRFHTQTLTQMPSWRQEEDDGLVLTINDSDEEAGVGFDDNDHVAVYEPAIENPNSTPSSKKRKRQSPSQTKQAQQSPTKNPNATILETPRKQIIKTIIPDSQPSDSPFTPLAAKEQGTPNKCATPAVPSTFRNSQRFWSPKIKGVDRTPLKSRSINVDKSTPIASTKVPVPPKSGRSEIPDSYSTVNGGLGSSPVVALSPSVGRSVQTRQPLAEIPLEEVTNTSVELGDDDVVERSVSGSRQSAESRRPEDTVIQDSDYESEGFLDDEDVLQVPGTPSPHSAVENIQQVSPTRAPIEGTFEEGIEILEDDDAQDVIMSTPSHTALRDITTQTLDAEDAARASEDLNTIPRSAPKSSTRQVSWDQAVRRSSTPIPFPDEDDVELETPSRSHRRPSCSTPVDKETPISSPQKTSPAMPAVSQLGYGSKSQAYESQRVPFEVIRQMAPQTDRSDVIVTISAEHVKQITEGTKTHEFRDFRLGSNVKRVWMYTPHPRQELKYMATISEFKLPGDIAPTDMGIGNAEFNQGKSTKYAYELMQVYQLNNPVSLERMMENGWVEQAPEKYEYVPPAVLGELMGNLRCALFEEHGYSQGTATVSQELAEQIRSDVAHSTQLRTGMASSSAQRRHTQIGALDVVSSSQNAEDMDGHVSATPPRSMVKNNLARQHDDDEDVFARPSAPSGHSQRSLVQIEDSPPIPRRPQSQQYPDKTTVRPSQATTVSAYTQSQTRLPSQRARTVPDEEVVVIEDSPMGARHASSSHRNNNDGYTQSSLGLGMLLRSSQGLALAGIGDEQDSLMDDSRIPMPPADVEIVWDSGPE